MKIPAWIQSTAGAVLSFGFGVADAWQFHAFDKYTDLLLIAAALSVLGVHTAYQVGKATPPNA